jgi:hypothetical protein
MMAYRSRAVSAIIQGVYEEALPLPHESLGSWEPINSKLGYKQQNGDGRQLD